jgi:plastocyanin
VSGSGRRTVSLVLAVGGLALALMLGGEREGPYVVTAIDYHFHDAHPTLPIGPGRDLIIKNAGRNLHNVTIPALGYSEDVRAGGRITIADVAARFGSSGTYSFVCLIHQDRGMTGSIVIADA